MIVAQSFCQTFTCSSFTVNDGIIMLAKNLDWDLGNGLIIYNPKGKNKKSIYCNESEIGWVSKYSSITFNHFGLNQPLGGINEAGLSIEELSTWQTQYSKNNKRTLNEFEWIQFQLDNYSTVDECIENILNYNILKFFFDLHYILTDSTGKTIVIEFLEGEPICYYDDQLPIPVLTNNNYKELIRYNDLIENDEANTLNVNFSQDRFVKINKLLKKKANHGYKLNHIDAMDILDSVSVSDTKWSIVYDILNKNIFYKTNQNKTLTKLNFSKFNQTRKYYYYNIKFGKAPEFKKFSSAVNTNYLEELKRDIFEYYGPDGIALINKINDLLQ